VLIVGAIIFLGRLLLFLFSFLFFIYHELSFFRGPAGEAAMVANIEDGVDRRSF